MATKAITDVCKKTFANELCILCKKAKEVENGHTLHALSTQFSK